MLILQERAKCSEKREKGAMNEKRISSNCLFFERSVLNSFHRTKNVEIFVYIPFRRSSYFHCSHTAVVIISILFDGEEDEKENRRRSERKQPVIENQNTHSWNKYNSMAQLKSLYTNQTPTNQRGINWWIEWTQKYTRWNIEQHKHRIPAIPG